MVDKTSGIEVSAINVLKRAVQLEKEKRFEEAVACYSEGIALLLDVLKSLKDGEKKTKYREAVTKYMEQAEKLKVYVRQQSQDTKFHEQIHVSNDSTGHGYRSVFSRCLDDQLTEIEIDDAYIRAHHQILNLVQFCEMCMASKSPLKRIILNTGHDQRDHGQQRQRLGDLASSLQTHGVQMTVNYSETLHDREIRFNNGWIVKIGRGLDYFKKVKDYTVGSIDLELRRCHETTIDTFHSKHVKADNR